MTIFVFVCIVVFLYVSVSVSFFKCSRLVSVLMSLVFVCPSVIDLFVHICLSFYLSFVLCVRLFHICICLPKCLSVCLRFVHLYLCLSHFWLLCVCLSVCQTLFVRGKHWPDAWSAISVSQTWSLTSKFFFFFKKFTTIGRMIFHQLTILQNVSRI